MSLGSITLNQACIQKMRQQFQPYYESVEEEDKSSDSAKETEATACAPSTTGCLQEGMLRGEDGSYRSVEKLSVDELKAKQKELDKFGEITPFGVCLMILATLSIILLMAGAFLVPVLPLLIAFVPAIACGTVTSVMGIGALFKVLKDNKKFKKLAGELAEQHVIYAQAKIAEVKQKQLGHMGVSAESLDAEKYITMRVISIFVREKDTCRAMEQVEAVFSKSLLKQLTARECERIKNGGLLNYERRLLMGYPMQAVTLF